MSLSEINGVSVMAGNVCRQSQYLAAAGRGVMTVANAMA
jgi:hypothetical protein